MENLIAIAATSIQAPVDKVWSALIDPEAIRKYMFGAEVFSEWKVGSPIVWRGEWKGKPFEDKGEVLSFEPNHLLQYTHFSPLSGKEDKPENYHTVTIELVPGSHGTRVRLEQDGNADDSARRHSEQNWGMMLTSLKQLLEHTYW